MKLKKQACAVILAVSVLSFTFTGCSGTKKETSNSIKTEAQETENAETDLSGEVVLSVGDTEVSYREVLLYMQSYKEEYESLYGEDIWSYTIDNEGNTFESLFKEQLLEEIKYLKTVCAQAQELEITLGEDELLDVDEYTADFMSSFTAEQLEHYKIDKEIVKKIYMDNVLANKIYESLTLNVDTDVSDEEARQMVLQYILVANHTYDEEGNRVEYNEEQLKQAKERADQLREQALTEENFYTLASANTDDEDEIEITAGKGDMMTELEKVAFSMKQGEISNVIETDMGYFILYCVSELDREATDAVKEELIAKRQEEAFDTRYTEWEKNTKTSLNDELWNSISFEDLPQ